MRDYCSVIHSVDRNVGRVYDYLKAHGLLENTVIIYTSDQGFYMGEHGYFDKRFMYEESFRTPLVVRMPGGKPVKAAKGRTRVLGADFGHRANDIDEFVQNIDYAPTILEMAGLPVPEDIQGMHFYHDIDEWELFDLKQDPLQLKNLYGTPGTETLTEELMAELHRLQALYEDPIEQRL